MANKRPWRRGSVGCVDSGVKRFGRSVFINGMSRSSGRRRLYPMKKTALHLIAEVPFRQSQGKLTIGIDLGDVWSHYCTLNEDGEVVEAVSEPHPR
jgi:hypothetical protein